MNFTEFLTLLGLYLVFFGLGLMIYMELFGLCLRFHFKFFPMLAKRYDPFFERINEKYQFDIKTSRDHDEQPIAEKPEQP